METAKNITVIDGKKAILGRLASFAAKQALLGKTIAIVNCNEIVISGRPKSIILEYQDIRQKGGAALKGPFFPKYPDRVVKRTIRGMLSFREGRGRAALKRIKCYNELPSEFEGAKKIVAGKEKKIKTISLKELAKEI